MGMKMDVLVVNCGSSSIKYRLFDMRKRVETADGMLERINEGQARLVQTSTEADGNRRRVSLSQTILDHAEGVGLIRSVLAKTGLVGGRGSFFGVGHRVVHGGEHFRAPVLIDERVIEAIRGLAPLAPLHNPANLIGIEAMRATMPEVPQVAVFDTAFHQSIPEAAHRYAIPRRLYEHFNIRRFGFHGTSHEYVTKAAAAAMRRELDDTNLISLHLGNGASAAAVAHGKSVDTSMGMTPMEGLVMGTRCGDLDPAIVFYLQRVTGESSADIETLLNTESGLKGLCGANDMREILARAAGGDPAAELAVEIYCYRVKKYIGAYYAVLGRVDALVFTAGIGVHAPEIRSKICAGLEHLGVEIDPAKNRLPVSAPAEIQRAGSPLKIFVIPTNEELAIAQQAAAVIRAHQVANRLK